MTPPGAAPALRVAGLSKTFGAARALTDAGLTIKAGQLHALVGENGSGKSTLIKILCGYHQPDPGGQIEIGGTPLPFGSPATAHQLGARFVHQDLGLVDTLSVADNLSMSGGYPSRLGTIRSRAWRARVCAALELVHADVGPDQMVGTLTAASRTGVALARALQQDDRSSPVLLVLDEPTASLPSAQVGELHRMVLAAASTGIGVLYVTHHLDEIFDVTDVVSVLRDGVVVAAATPTAGLTHADLVHLIVGTGVGSPQPAPRRPPSSAPVLKIVELSSGPLAPISFEGEAGEVIGIAGVTGSGRENLLPTIFGAAPRDGGSVAVSGVRLAPASPRRSIAGGVTYLPADRRASGGVMALTARENLSLSDLRPFWRFPMLRRKSERAVAEQWLERLSVRPVTAAEKPLETFSGGNQQKVLMAKWLRLEPLVLLLDDPTQGVDIGAKALLHEHITAAAQAGACVVVSSSDNHELASLCSRVIVLRGGFLGEELVGSDVTVAAITRASLARPEMRAS